MIASWKRMIGWTGDSGDSDACVQGSLKFALSRDKFSYAVAGAEISITSADIPETFLGKPVSSIGCGAFGGCSKLTSVAIPGSVRAIGSFAFLHCDSLSSVSFGGDRRPIRGGNRQGGHLQTVLPF